MIPAGDLVRVVAPHFVAGLIMRDERVIYAAPILAWARGMRRQQLAATFARKRFTATILPARVP